MEKSTEDYNLTLFLVLLFFFCLFLFLFIQSFAKDKRALTTKDIPNTNVVIIIPDSSNWEFGTYECKGWEKKREINRR